MLWLGLSCLSTKSHYICFILFAATSSVSVAAACASSTSSRMSSLTSFAFPSPTLPLYCLLAYSLFAISAFFTVYFNGLAKVLLSLYIYNIYKDKCIYTRTDFAHAVLATPTMAAHAIVNYLLTTYCVLSYCFSVAFCFEIINNGRCQVKGGFWD